MDQWLLFRDDHPRLTWFSTWHWKCRIIHIIPCWMAAKWVFCIHKDKNQIVIQQLYPDHRSDLFSFRSWSDLCGQLWISPITLQCTALSRDYHRESQKIPNIFRVYWFILTKSFYGNEFLLTFRHTKPNIYNLLYNYWEEFGRLWNLLYNLLVLLPNSSLSL